MSLSISQFIQNLSRINEVIYYCSSVILSKILIEVDIWGKFFLMRKNISDIYMMLDGKFPFATVPDIF